MTTVLKACSFYVMSLQVDALVSNPHRNMPCLGNLVTSNFCGCTSCSTPVCRFVLAPVVATQHLKAFLRDCSELKRLIKNTQTYTILYYEISYAVVTKNLVLL